jgi:CRP-like cAMP-binding protein
MTTAYERGNGYWIKLSAAERIALTRVSKHLTVASGCTLLSQQDTSRDVLVIQSGFTKVIVRTAVARHVVLALRGPGEILGEMAYVSGGTRTAAVSALTDVQALRIRQTDFDHFLSGSAHASSLLRRTLVDRLRDADLDRVAAASMTMGQRLAALLLTQARRYGVRSADGGLTVTLLSQDDLAACVGGARRTVAREIAQWRARDIVSTTRMSVTIRDPASLARIATLSTSAFCPSD